MIDLPPISPSYPVKKPDRVIRERKKQPDQQQTSDSDNNNEAKQLDELSPQHIDEIV